MRKIEFLKMLVLYLPVRDLKMLSEMNATITYWGRYLLVSPGLCPRDVYCHEGGRHLHDANQIMLSDYSYLKWEMWERGGSDEVSWGDIFRVVIL